MTTNVFVRARDATRPIEWDVGFNNPPAQGKVPITVGQGSGPEDIIFHLLGTPGVNANFDTADPIWVTSSGSCPTQSGLDPQISISQISQNLLTISDSNARAGNLHYQLNFQGNVDPCDPIIINGGVGSSGGGGA
jgi:hypothetical protein